MKITNETSAAQEMFAKTVLRAWTMNVTRVNDLLESLPDDVLKQDVAPGRNSGVYLLGHLTATHDGMIPLLGFGSKLYPQLEKPFYSPDKSGNEFPSIAELKKYWKEVNDRLAEHFSQLEPEEWLTRHTSVSAEDFEKEPHRNKLSVLISRTTHMSSHLGQLIFLKPRK